MGRQKKGTIPGGAGCMRPEPFVILLTPRVLGDLQALMRTGFYGATVPDTCTALIWRGIEDAIAKGTMDRKGFPK